MNLQEEYNDKISLKLNAPLNTIVLSLFLKQFIEMIMQRSEGRLKFGHDSLKRLCETPSTLEHKVLS